jgi:hypothetical protein
VAKAAFHINLQMHIFVLGTVYEFLYRDIHGSTSHLNNGVSQNKFVQEKVAETTKQKEEKRKNAKPEEHEDMPPHQHYPLAKRRGDRNPKYHEEQQKDVA